jgi:hypothetical protein
MQKAFNNNKFVKEVRNRRNTIRKKRVKERSTDKDKPISVKRTPRGNHFCPCRRNDERISRKTERFD